MNVLIVGSSGMVGQGVLSACLAAADVRRIVLLVRREQAVPADAGIEQIVLPDLMRFDAAKAKLGALDACFFCAGVSAAGMSEADYRRATLELTLHIARQLAAVREDMHFIYISGAGADSSEQSRSMWKRVRGETENALLASTLQTTIFRPAFIMAEPGMRSKTALYEALYTVMRPLMRAVSAVSSYQPLSTRDIGAAMLNSVRQQRSGEVLEAEGIKARSRINPSS